MYTDCTNFIDRLQDTVIPKEVEREGFYDIGIDFLVDNKGQSYPTTGINRSIS